LSSATPEAEVRRPPSSFLLRLWRCLGRYPGCYTVCGLGRRLRNACLHEWRSLCTKFGVCTNPVAGSRACVIYGSCIPSLCQLLIW